MPSIVVFEHEVLVGRQLSRALEAEGHEVHVAPTAAEGLAVVRKAHPDLVLLDLRLPDGSGPDVLRGVLELDAAIPVVLMTAFGAVRDVVEAMRRGATDYLEKPLDLDELSGLIERVLTRQRRDRELAYHRDRGRALPKEVVSVDSSLIEIFAQVDRLRDAGLAPGKRPAILLTGETGTGKGVVARAIHERLGGGPFIDVNCLAMPRPLIEAELFGHERGAFTDAKAGRPGLFEAGEGGTIFLDEIGHAPLEVQTKLLTAIEEKRIRRLGASGDRAVNTHILAATNRDLDAALEAGEFRRDLLHRLRVIAFDLAPLRERTLDLPLLARHFCEEIGRLYGRSVKLHPDCDPVLARYPWPGNVRELRNVIERSILLEPGDELRPQALARFLSQPAETGAASSISLPEGGISLADLERDLIRQALDRADGNRTRAAALLGLTRDTLRYRLEKFGLDRHLGFQAAKQKRR